MQRLLIAFQKEQIAAINVEILHPDGGGALKKTAGSPSEKQEVVGTPSFMWYPQMIKLS